MQLLSILLFSVFFMLVKCEIFSSVDSLANLHSNQDILFEEFDKLIGNLEENFKNIERKSKIIKNENELMKKDVHNYIINPFNAFQLIKSLSYDVENVQNMILKTICNFSQNVEQIKLPTSDLKGAVEGFYRLQQTYDLKPDDIAKGVIQNEKYRDELKADDLYVLGKDMINFNTTYAEEYLKLALEKNEKSKVMETRDILEELLTCYNKSRKYDDAIAVFDKILELDPNNETLSEDRVNYELDVVFGVFEAERKDFITHQSEQKIIFDQACRREILKSPAEASKLYCFMQSNTPFTKIAPFKVEIMNFNPYVVIFHEILSDREIETFKNLARVNLTRAEVMATKKPSIVSTIRVAKMTWLLNFQNKMLGTLTKRVADMSGLNMDTAEPWQVQNYGIGGHYMLHPDFSHEGLPFRGNSGNRIATTLFYLSDVEKGGATVFPYMKLYIPPKKGTAAFWFNLSTSGDREYITMHGACPVLVGSKWVSNKWLREYGQERYRPCELVHRPSIHENSFKLELVLHS